MARTKTYRIFIWIIAILLATNLSMGFSFLYHKQQDKKMMEKQEATAIEVPAQRRTRFFREQLNLKQNQIVAFRELNRDFNQNARLINRQLEALRIEMVNELGKENPDQSALDSISKKVGNLHTKLKEETIEYYLKMKNECSEEQMERLNDIFMSMLKRNEDVKLPQNGRNRILRE